MPNLTYKTASPQPADGLPEVCLNLWYVCDGSGLAYRLAGRAYALRGTDDEKLTILRSLAATDFYVALLFVVPSRYKLVTSTGERSGLVTPGVIRERQSEVFKEVIDSLESALPVQMCSVDGQPQKFKLKIPEEPLLVQTCVMEDEAGHLTPLIGD